MKVFKKKAQSTLEYGIIVAVVVGALLAMQVYMKRGVQGRARSSIDSIGEQYSAGITTSKYITEAEKSETKELIGTDGTFSGIGSKGVTFSQVTTAGKATKKAVGNNAENIKGLSKEKLLKKQGSLFD